MIVRVHWCLASQWRPGELAAAVGDDFVHVHVELSATACHPHMQRKHVVMLAGQNFVAGLRDQLVLLIAQPVAGTVCFRNSFLQNGIGRDHLPWDQVLANAEMFERALSLRAPQLVSGNIDFAETISLLAHVWFASVSSCTHGLSAPFTHCAVILWPLLEWHGRPGALHSFGCLPRALRTLNMTLAPTAFLWNGRENSSFWRMK